MNLDLSTLLLEGGQFAIPSGVEGRRLIETLDYGVPRRSQGRRAAHRERYCFIALLKALIKNSGDLFPLSVWRGESPDFIISTADGLTFAIEHTDAGERDYQQHLANTENSDDPVFVPSPGGCGWVGNVPEEAFTEALKAALSKKIADKVWRNAPIGAARCLLMYDQTNTGLFIEDRQANALLREAVLCAAPWSGTYRHIFLVRGPDRVLRWPDRKEVA